MWWTVQIEAHIPGGRLKYKDARMCVFGIWKQTHFEWHFEL